MLVQLLVPVAAVVVAVLVAAVLVKLEKQLVGKYNTSFPFSFKNSLNYILYCDFRQPLSFIQKNSAAAVLRI